MLEKSSRVPYSAVVGTAMERAVARGVDGRSRSLGCAARTDAVLSGICRP
jgi:hypothetical protein